MPVVKDRRSSLRVAIEGKVLVHTEREQFEGRCIDLGLDGIAIQSTRSTRSRKLVTLEAFIHGQHLRLDAVLARRQRLGGDYLMGLAFVDLDLDTRRRIEHIVFERLASTPQAGFMRAFVAHAERVPPPPAAREGAIEHTVVAGVMQVPVISGHTQIVDLAKLSMVDRTVIAPAPTRGDTVRADAAPLPEYTPAPIMAPVQFDDSWFDDEMDTAQFRLLEAQRAQEQASKESSEPEHTQVTDEADEGPPASEHTQVTGDTDERPPTERTIVADPLRRASERTQVTGDVDERPPASERTQVTGDVDERPPASERTQVTGDVDDRPLAERTAVLAPAPLRIPSWSVGAPEPVAVVHTARATVVFELGSHPVAQWPVMADPPSPPPLLRGEPAERTTTGTTEVRIPPALALRPTLRALLEAAALLRRPDPAPRRGPRVIVAIPHRSYRRVAAEPWNR
jgi:hypothetical protein